MSYLTCLECGGDTHKEEIKNKNAKGYTVQKIVCNHCENEGKAIDWGGMNPHTDIQEGSFAELTEEGLETIRENLGFVPVYEQ